MNFEELYNSVILTKESVLIQVDEYTLYCFYTGLEDLQLNTAYNTPYRVDNRPSFSVYESKYSQYVDYYWKDSATGESGDIFKLIGLIEQLNDRKEILAKINEDFELGYETQRVEPKEKIVRYIRPKTFPIKIRIAPIPFTSAGIKFWQQYNIDQDLLKMYDVDQIQWYWSYNDQQAPKTVPDPAFSYRVGGYYQIYSPFSPRDEKWRNDLPDNYFFGYVQLPKNGDMLIIDKSPKDVIFCRRLGYWAIAPKSESILIPHEKMLELKERFKRVFITLDPDPCGEMMTEKYMKLYPWLEPRFLAGVKDKSDACKLYGFDQAKVIINDLLR